MFYNENLFLLFSCTNPNFLFLRYGPKCSQPIRLQVFILSPISRTNQWNSLIFFACLCKFTSIKSWSKNVLKHRCSHSDHGTLRLTISQEFKNELMERIYFLHTGTNSGELKVDSMILGMNVSVNNLDQLTI